MKLEETLLVLFDNKVQYVLIGGAAMQLQGWPRLTEDLDFCYERSKQNVERLAEALEPFHVTLRGAPNEPAISLRRAHYSERFELYCRLTLARRISLPRFPD